MKARNYQRFPFNKPLNGHLHLKEYKGKQLSSKKYSPIKILNISQGGLCFASNLNFPCSKHYSVEITFGREKVTGYIVWQQSKPDNYVYGLQIVSSSTGFLMINHDFKNFQLNRGLYRGLSHSDQTKPPLL